MSTDITMTVSPKKQIKATASTSVTLIITSIAGFSSSMSIFAVNVAVPTIGSELVMKAVLLVWITNAVMLASAALFIPFGRLADIYGRKKIFLYGFYVNVVSAVLCSIAGSGESFIIYRILQGIGGAMTLGTSIALITSIFPAHLRGRALGINVAALYFGIAGGPSLGGIITQHLGWRSIFYLLVILGLIVIVLTLWKLKGDWTEARGEKLDIAGALILSISLILIMYGFTGLPSTGAIAMLLFGLLGMFIFVWVEARTRSPILEIKMFRDNNTFIFSNIAGLLHLASVATVAFFASLYLQYIKGFSPQTAGFILLVQPALGTIFSVVAGRLSDKVEPQLIASFAMLLLTIGLSLLCFLTATTGLMLFIFCLAIVGLGQSFFSSPNMHAIMSSVDIKYLGAASGTQQTARIAGMVFGMGITMIAFQFFIGDVQLTPAYYPDFIQSLHVCFIIAAVLSFTGMFIQLAGRNRTNRSE
jgi:MFS family permease